MKTILAFLLAVYLLVPAVSAQTETITVTSFVKILNEKRSETFYYYENNWKVLREMAAAKRYIHSFEIIEPKPDEKAEFDLILITRYEDQFQFGKAEENFRILIKKRGPVRLLNKFTPKDFRKTVYVKTGKSRFAASPAANGGEIDCDPKVLKDFEFLLGNWVEKNRSGKMRITKMLAGCGIQETWDLKDFRAILLRSYDSATKKWYLTFTAHDLVPQVWEGRIENGTWRFYRDWVLNGNARRSRTYWKKGANNSFVKIVEQLNDDKKTWRLHDSARFQKESNHRLGTNKRVKLDSDGWEIFGDLRIPESTHPVPAVILLNKAYGNRAVYKKLSEHLAAIGIASIRVDLRAHGESVNKGKFGPPFDEKMRSLLTGTDRDISAVYNYLKKHSGIASERIGFVGASYSGEEMMASARTGEYGKAYVALSPGSFSEESMDSIDKLKTPWFFVKSVGEIALMNDVFLTLRQKSKTARILEVAGKKHASDILEDHPEIAELIATWFRHKL
jgi:dienelactone hydrolase